MRAIWFGAHQIISKCTTNDLATTKYLFGGHQMINFGAHQIISVLVAYPNELFGGHQMIWWPFIKNF